jgi:type IV secretory pathway TraG/TraD family ATPase VirD4
MAQISSNPLTAQLVAGDQAVVDLRAAMDQRKVVLVRLSKGVIGDYEARFLGSLFLMSLAEAALSRARTPVSERTPFRVYIDEFQTMATQSAADMLAECRKYGLCLTLANQSLSQLVGDKFNPASVGQAALANCASFALFRMGLADAAIMAATIDGLSASELTHLNVGEMVIRRLSGGTPLAAEWVFGLPPPTARSIGPLR